MANENGQCVIERELGRGSYGSVYLLTCSPSLSQQPLSKYALKVIDEHGARKQDRETACKELRIMRDLYHPSIVALVDSFEVSQRLFLVLELCEGGDLRSFLDNVKEGRQSESGGMPGVEESLVVRWTKQLAAGLAYMHHKKILHRDLKPQNIFLKDKFNIKIGDLGIARQLLFTKEMAATHIGTPLYISPEMYQGNPYSYKTDVWSLGCCVYEMMTLRYAFHAPSRYELVGKVVNKQVLPLPQCYKPGLAGLVMSMLHKGPEHRPDASQIMQALQELDPQMPQPASKENQREAAETGRPERPTDTRSLQVWRLEMAKALNRFLGRKQAAQSAQLAAALAERLALGNIRDVQDSAGSDVASSLGGGVLRARTPQRLQISNSVSGSDATKTGEDDSDGDGDDDDDIATSSSSHSFKKFYDQKSDSLMSSWSSTEATLLSSEEGCLQREALKKSRGRAHMDHSSGQSTAGSGPHRPLSKDQRASDSGDSYMLSNCRKINSESSTLSVGSAQGSSEVRCIKIGKSSIVVKSRPLPYPQHLREHVDTSDISHTDQTVSNLGAFNSSSMLTAHSSLAEEEFSSSAPLKNASILHPPGTGPNFSNEDVHRAYANEVMKWTRAKLSSHGPPGGSAVGSQGYKTCMASGTTELDSSMVPVGGAGDSVVQDEEDVAAMLEDAAQVSANQKRGKRKKRNFLKERKSNERKQDEEVSTTVQAPAQEKKRSVTLFTRGQRVSFTNQKEDELDLTIGQDRNETPMARVLGKTKLHAAVSTAILLRSSPALLQFQLRELLGRENYKTYATAIVDLAEQSA